MTKPSEILKFLLTSILIIGIIFRFTNLDKKVYWGDETFTSLRISGYTSVELEQEISQDKIYTQQDIQKYQLINSEKGLNDTVKGLAQEEPQFPPIYFAAARFWVHLFGNSIAVTRSLSAFIGIFIFPLTYWLCLELFDSALVGWIAIAIMAVSPVQVLYAQEARPYSLWMITVLLSTASFLRALRVKTQVSWVIYTATSVLGFYSYLLNILVVISHGIYLYIRENFRFSKIFIAYLVSAFTSFVLFLPWIVTIFINLNSLRKTSDWALEDIPISGLTSEWVRNISYSFMDFWFYFTYFPKSPFNIKFATYLIPLLLLLVVYSFYFISRKTSPKIWLLLYILMIFNAIPLTFPDLMIGGYRSIMARYFFPCYLGIQLSVAYLFASKIQSENGKSLQANIWRLGLLSLLIGGIVSCGISSQMDTWWNKRTISHDHLLIAETVNRNHNSLLIMEANKSAAISLSYRLKADTKYKFIDGSKITEIPDGFSHIFLIESGSIKAEHLQKQQKLPMKLVYKGRKKNLWEIF
ncbi:glycosyltransferase family 39 protein [Aliinostoc sp. HNIBRCY26]|uniref:glycosyltransferase family 39 protein n=1 Tax=Aliinostoc sp. HNIBRCY26 TaxID=3418997 RepID=UPI003D018431